ncbi:hypothetical protein LX32DRAFT_641899 [Colletotrichum zoysiae]|uniref:Uncharacterized protein n=1 Tax=Colletotrichum zoysiae TaxID=1216348 RepID=A0AAD9HE63_9PEZI|nr:hypothetical protein LX32DRAFT_641899 [Colletotrichum zoysiae]
MGGRRLGRHVRRDHHRGPPPVIHHGTDEQKSRWLTGLFTGETSFYLRCAEPTGGLGPSKPKNHGNQKRGWRASCGGWTQEIDHRRIAGYPPHDDCCVDWRPGNRRHLRACHPPLDLPRVSRRRITNSGRGAGDSTWVTLDNVKVPADHLIGHENSGFRCIMTSNITRVSLSPLSRAREINPGDVTYTAGDFNRERFILAVFHERTSPDLSRGRGLPARRGGDESRADQQGLLRVNVVGGGSEEIISDLAVRREMGAAAGRGAEQ